MPDRRAVQLRNELVISRNRAQAGLDAVTREARTDRVRGDEQLIEDYLVRIVRLDQTIKVHDAFVKMVDVAFGIRAPEGS